MSAGADDITRLLRDQVPLDRSWRGMAWALVVSLALHLGIAGPLLYLLSQATWGPSAPVLAIELSMDDRAAAGDPQVRMPETPVPTPATPAATASPALSSVPSAAPAPVMPQTPQRTVEPEPVPDSKPPVSAAPPQPKAAATPVASAATAPATRSVERTPPDSSAAEPAPRDPGFQLVYAPRPVYPRVARQLGLEGRVVLGIWVTADGVPDVVVVKQSSGYDSLDDSAIEGVRKWRFEAGEAAGIPAGGWVTQPVIFRLE